MEQVSRMDEIDVKRGAILTAASAALREASSLSMNSVAKQAGVGVGTVYRHFATPDALVLAVYEREIRALLDSVPELLEKHPVAEAFQLWVVDHLAHYFTVKNGLVNALRGSSEIPTTRDNVFVLLSSAVRTLLAAGIAEGTIRSDIDSDVIVRGLGGLLLDFDRDRQSDAEQLVQILWRGMLAPSPAEN